MLQCVKTRRKSHVSHHVLIQSQWRNEKDNEELDSLPFDSIRQFLKIENLGKKYIFEKTMDQNLTHRQFLKRAVQLETSEIIFECRKAALHTRGVPGVSDWARVWLPPSSVPRSRLRWSYLQPTDCRRRRRRLAQLVPHTKNLKLSDVSYCCTAFIATSE
jgi:hypothetical protein